ncbi:MAG TPA: hypothetical protein PKW18_06915 [Candidatus Sumerlaeota bacterium]|nr:hypothetical protein [Candidatus Sumerlaeota bacterium]HQH11150.1 hypothetical protein [Candidatus Sumerlaeota bacterium]HRS00559.1 hypothetical protein [Candidatus Sumerlaeia bacterium]
MRPADEGAGKMADGMIRSRAKYFSGKIKNENPKPPPWTALPDLSPKGSVS